MIRTALYSSFSFAVPFYDDNSLEASSRRDNHKEVTSFEAPYSSNGYEPANSSKCLLIYAFDQRKPLPNSRLNFGFYVSFAEIVLKLSICAVQ